MRDMYPFSIPHQVLRVMKLARVKRIKVKRYSGFVFHVCNYKVTSQLEYFSLCPKPLYALTEIFNIYLER